MKNLFKNLFSKPVEETRYKTQYKICLDIKYKLSSLVNNFPDDFNKIWNMTKINDVQYSSIDPLELTMFLLFGINKSNNSIKKIDYNKNKNLLKTIIRSTGTFDDSITFVTELIKLIDNRFHEIDIFFDAMNPEVNTNPVPENTLLNKNEFYYLKDMHMSFIEEITSFRNRSFTLKTLANNANSSMDNPTIHKYLKSDTLKRYYFSHVYDLKNNVMIFDKNFMLFGEIDNLMRNFDNIFNFLFGDFICIYQTMTNQIDYIIDTYNASTK